jgi:membrane protease YdiL (CAAX protease family)
VQFSVAGEKERFISIMNGRISLWVKAHPLITYFALAYAISWVIVLPLVARKQGFIDMHIPFALHYLNDYAPLLAALITARIADGPDGLGDLLRRMVRWRVGWGWVLLAAFLPLVVFAVAAGIVVLALGEAPPNLGLLGKLPFLPYLGFGGWIFWMLTAGLGEESGWRGYALPKLQRNMSALSATMIVSLFWVGWHLPRFFYFDGFVRAGFSVLPTFVLQQLVLSIVLAWLYNSARGSIPAPALFHAGFNFFLASPAVVGDIYTVIRETQIVLAIAVIVLFKPANLSRRGKHVL